MLLFGKNAVKCVSPLTQEIEIAKSLEGGSSHPFFLPAHSIQGLWRWLECIPAVLGREAGYTLNRSIAELCMENVLRHLDRSKHTVGRSGHEMSYESSVMIIFILNLSAVHSGKRWPLQYLVFLSSGSCLTISSPLRWDSMTEEAVISGSCLTDPLYYDEFVLNLVQE